MWEDQIKLGFGNSLVKGAVSEKLTPERIVERILAEPHMVIESYGLFDIATPNYTTYYPDVKAEDLNPDDKEFIHPTFRALSEVIVHKKYNPVDFSTPGVLKKSLSLLVGATVNPDHESFAVGNAVGSVKRTAWQDSYKTEGGILVPAGINAQFKIDGKSNPRIARGIMMDPPSIHSSSVTVQFLWDKSHPDMADDEFFGKLGTFDKDGKMIRRMATKIKKYPEISLVAHGADPYAQKIGEDGQINNPKYAHTTYNSEQSVKVKREEKYFFFDYKVDLVENKEDNTIPIISNADKTLSDMDELLLAFATALGMTGDKFTKELILSEIALKLGKITELTTQNTTLSATGTTQTAEITRLKALESELILLKAANPTAGDASTELTRLRTFESTLLNDARTRVTTIYNKVMQNKPDAAINAMIAKADLAALAALETQYTAQLNQMYPDKCGKCGSTTITRASAAVVTEDDKKGEPGDGSLGDTISRMQIKKRKENSIQLNAEPAPAKK